MTTVGFELFLPRSGGLVDDGSLGSVVKRSSCAVKAAVVDEKAHL
jgi:hypothetical protein